MIDHHRHHTQNNVNPRAWPYRVPWHPMAPGDATDYSQRLYMDGRCCLQFPFAVSLHTNIIHKLFHRVSRDLNHSQVSIRCTTILPN
jgi:hypothetical protein